MPKNQIIQSSRKYKKTLQPGARRCQNAGVIHLVTSDMMKRIEDEEKVEQSIKKKLIDKEQMGKTF